MTTISTVKSQKRNYIQNILAIWLKYHGIDLYYTKLRITDLQTTVTSFPLVTALLELFNLIQLVHTGTGSIVLNVISILHLVVTTAVSVINASLSGTIIVSLWLGV